MAGPTILSTGDVISAALDSSEGFPDASHGFYNETRALEGQIVKIYAVDDPQNRYKSVTCYDVMVTMNDGGTETINYCRALQPLFGGTFNNFFEVLPPDPGVKAKEGIDSDLKKGTKVLVLCVCGQKMAGVIIGALPHLNKIAVKRRPSKSKGTYLEGEFQGLNFNITQQGALKITFNGPRNDSGAIAGSSGPTTIELDASGNIKLNTNSEQSIEVDREANTISILNGETSFIMEQNGSTITAKCDKFNVEAKKEINIVSLGKATIKAVGEIIVNSATMIKLQKGDSAPAEPFVLGKEFVAFMKTLLQNILSHKHVGNLGMPTPLFPPDIPKFQNLLNTPIADEKILSKHIIGTK